ncbi:MAG: DUF86 domain-containing protein [Selenomonadaceae bacterium]|nr:DUF86 domain-containing protein [Selenomonadaceae bacterium]
MQDRNRVNKVVIKKILEYCDRIENFINRFGPTFKDYCNDEAFQFSCSACIIQIGELTNQFSDDFKANHTEIPWHKIKGLRNLHVHEYEKVKPNKMWEILTEDVPNLKTQLTKILSAEAESK